MRRGRHRAGAPRATLFAVSRQESPDLAAALATVRVQANMLGLLLAHELRVVEEVRRAEHAERMSHLDALTEVGNRRAWVVTSSAPCSPRRTCTARWRWPPRWGWARTSGCRCTDATVISTALELRAITDTLAALPAIQGFLAVNASPTTTCRVRLSSPPWPPSRARPAALSVPDADPLRRPDTAHDTAHVITD